MNKESENFDTPLPGVIVSEIEAAKLIIRLLLRFRKTDPAKVSSNIPTACVLDGMLDDQVLTRRKFKERLKVYVFVEGAGIVFVATPQEIINYLSARQPWEDYDICLFDENMEWCIGLTHNGQVIVAGSL